MRLDGGIITAKFDKIQISRKNRKKETKRNKNLVEFLNNFGYIVKKNVPNMSDQIVYRGQ